MDQYSFSHLGDQELLRALAQALTDERISTAHVLALIAEVDARKLYLPAGDDSMYAYCVRELHLSEDCALKRIRAARAARAFPAIFEAVAEGRLHLSGIALLARHLRPENAAQLLAAAAHKTCAQIQLVIAQHFPQPDRPARLEAVLEPGVSSCQTLLAARPVDASSNRPGGHPATAPETPRPSLAPLSPQRFLLQATIGLSAHDKLRYLQALLGHAVPTGDLEAVLERSFDAHIALIEKQKFGATSRPRPGRASQDPRHIPTAVKRAVWERDGGQCSFVGEGGHTCGSRVRLEYDHVDPVARGGEATVDGIRLRCRAHNQYEAECVFGAGFMASKREAARLAAAEARARTAAARAAAAEERARAAAEKREKAAEEARVAAAERDPDRSVIPWLMQLGFRLNEAREAAATCESMGEAPMEERIKAALRYFRTRTTSPGRAA
jgi:hypothetical protein